MKILKGLVNWFRDSDHRHALKALEEFGRDTDRIESEYNNALRRDLQSAVDYSEGRLTK